jgi:site-specific DNA-adenine methylase
MNLSNLQDESLIAFYESVRRQVRADLQSGGRYRFVGETTRQYADSLREEMNRRRMEFKPIDWHR